MKKLLILAISALGFLCSCDDKEPEVKPHIDLAAESLEFSVEKTGQFEGNVTITGIVKNIADPYQSREGQQAVRLIQKDPGGQTTTLVTKNFKDLDAGGTLEIEHLIQGWRTSREFPPSFILRISYDPDLHIDGNPLNDDANYENNFLERPGQDINALFQ